METNNQMIYKADLYLRLSLKDGDKAESDSITNQRDLLMAFLTKYPEIKLNEVRIDDGYSGTNYDRPGFQAMMESVKNKEVNCIIVKDLSRLGRNFIETGKYIEKIFPFMGIRFISVNDNYDSSQPRTASDNLLVPVKNLMNDSYCRDISIKIRSQLDIKRKKGEFIGAFPVYGYQKDPEQKRTLMIDEHPASVVRTIFSKKLEGYSSQAIADWLNALDELSPIEYKRYRGSSFSSPFKRNASSVWTAVAVSRILKNCIYTGTLIQGKRSTPNYKVRRTLEVPEEKWIVVENCHEPIIDRELFAAVTKLLLVDTRTAPSAKVVYPLAGLVYCADCGRNMVRKNNSSVSKPYYYYICSGYKQKTGCTSHNFSVKKLEEAVLIALQEHIRNILDIEVVLQSIEKLPYASMAVKRTQKWLRSKQEELEKFHRYKLKLHEDYVDGILSRQEYIDFGKRYDGKIEEAEGAVFKLEQEITELASGNTEEQQWITYFTKHKNIKELNRKLAVELIDSIKVYENHRIYVTFRFQAMYDQLVDAIKAGHYTLVPKREVV